MGSKRRADGGQHTVADYTREAEGLNIVKIIYMEVDVDPAQHDAEAEYVLELCQRKENRMVAALIHGDPGTDDFDKMILRYKGSPFIKGVRQVLHGGQPRGYCLQEKFIRGCHLLGKLGMRYDICVRSEELPDAAKLLDACPNTQFVLDHCGNANVQAADLSAWRRDLTEVARRNNVVCKIS